MKIAKESTIFRFKAYLISLMSHHNIFHTYLYSKFFNEIEIEKMKLGLKIKLEKYILKKS